MFVGPDAQRIDLSRFETNPAIQPGMAPAQLAYVLSQYAGEIRWTDEHLGRFFALLQRKGLWENTAILITADHGEEFFEHGEKGHKHNLFAETIHVPLLLKLPGSRERPRRPPSREPRRRASDAARAGRRSRRSFPHQGRSLLEANPPPTPRDLLRSAFDLVLPAPGRLDVRSSRSAGTACARAR